jgi:arylsulfatase A-like enzyme
MTSGLRLGLALGLLFASAELAVLAFSPYRPGAGSIAWIVATDAVAALVLSAVAERLGGGDDADRAGRAAGWTAFVLAGAYVAHGIAMLASEGQYGGILLLAVPPLLAVAATVGARRIARWGREDAVVTVAAGLLAVVASIAPFAPTRGGTVAADRPSVLVVTVDGLRADGGSGQDGLLDAMGALVPNGVRFTHAITPTPGSRAANAVVQTGLHPLRTGVLDERDRLTRARPTLFEALAAAGWPTAAFVSSSAAGRDSGLVQGFDRFDDGWTHAEDSALASLGVGLWTRLFDRDAVGRWSARDDAATAQRFADWVSGRAGPVAAWVHLSDPHRVELGGLSTPTTARAFAILASAVPANALVVVVGTHGELGGAHGGRGAATLFDPVVHVPLVVRFPGDPPAVTEVSSQVRTLDVVATVLDALKVETKGETEGLPLTGYAAGSRQASPACSLIGRDLDGTWLVGLRTDRVKVIDRDGKASVYLLDQDPREQVDRAADQPQAVAQVQGMLQADRAALGAR